MYTNKSVLTLHMHMTITNIYSPEIRGAIDYQKLHQTCLKKIKVIVL